MPACAGMTVRYAGFCGVRVVAKVGPGCTGRIIYIFSLSFLKIRTMSKSRRLLVGILSLLPLILLAVYLIVFFSFMMQMFRHPHEEDVMAQMMMEHIGGIVAIGLLMGIAHLALLIYFIIHAVNNKRTEGTERIVWILIFIFAGMVGFPIYWYMRIWKDGENIADTHTHTAAGQV
jgi:tellurite resistance protein TehA-like permease